MEVLDSDQRGQAGFIELRTQLLGGTSDLERDVAAAEPVVDLPDRLDRTGVDAADRGRIEYQVSHRLGAPSTADQRRRLKKCALAKNSRSWIR